MLKESYGKMKMKKGSVLYHTSENKFVVDIKKLFLFLTFHPSEWGEKYPICTIEQPVKLKLNLRYKSMIEEYKKYEKKSKYLLDNVFQIILENAKIYYHKADLDKMQKELEGKRWL